MSITIHDAPKSRIICLTKTKGLLPSNFQFLVKRTQQRLRGQTINKTVTNQNHTEPKQTKIVIWNWVVCTISNITITLQDSAFKIWNYKTRHLWKLCHLCTCPILSIEYAVWMEHNAKTCSYNVSPRQNCTRIKLNSYSLNSKEWESQSSLEGLFGSIKKDWHFNLPRVKITKFPPYEYNFKL